jgi:6-phosphogluconolactonase
VQKGTLYTTAGPLGVLGYKTDPETGRVDEEPIGRFETDGSAVSAAAAAAAGAAADGEDAAAPIPTAGGAGVCFIVFSKAAGGLLCANYDAGSVSLLASSDDSSGVLGTPTSAKHPVPGAEEEAGIDGSRQDGPHPHGIFPDPSGRWAVACDLGSNVIVTYSLPKLVAVAGAPSKLHAGAGPRHAVFHPSGNRLFCVNELDNTVSAFTFDQETGALSPEEVGTWSTLPAEWLPSNP